MNHDNYHHHHRFRIHLFVNSNATCSFVYAFQIFGHQGLTTGFFCHFLLSLLACILLLKIWLSCRDYDVDRYGFCGAGVFGVQDRFYVSTSYIPTAMVPLWVTSMREQDKIQQHYYEWNRMRNPPSSLSAEKTKRH